MHIVCPHCENAIELVDVTLATDILCSSCGSSFRLVGGSTANWRPKDGQRFLGKFELLHPVGTGAFGTVYKARDTELDRIVAIKLPRAGNLDGSRGDTDRFLREARSVAQLRHPAIVPVYEVGQHEGLPFLVSEFVAGMTLADRMTGEALTTRATAELLADIADALHYAHKHGIIHRDVKPSNIMLDAEGRPHVMDFGLAKREAGEITMTLDGQVLGTPAYMSPEQASGEGHHVDGRSDVYSLGVVLYQLLTGKLPFKGNARMLLHHLLHDEPVPPRNRVADIPRDLETICLKAMAKNAKQRYASAAELAADLRRFLAGEPIKTRRVGVTERAMRWVRRRPAEAALLLLSIAMVALAGGWGIWWWQREASARQRDADRLRAEEEARQLKVEYFAHIVKRWGIPEGIGPLTDQQARKRYITYKLYRRGGLVEAAEIVNGHGVLSPQAGNTSSFDPLTSLRSDSLRREPCRYEYKRNQQGQLTQEIAYDHLGEIAWILQYPSPTVAYFADRKGFPRARTGSGLSFVEFTWTDDGLDREVHYLDKNGQRRPDQNGIYGVRKQFNARGQATSIVFLDSQDQPALSRNGYAEAHYEHDAQSNVRVATYFDRAGRPALRSGRWAKLVWNFDDFGNWKESMYFDLEGKPTYWQGKVARITRISNEHGDLIAQHHFDPEGKPALDVQGTAGWIAEHNAQGERVSLTYLGLDGKPGPCIDLYTRLVTTYDPRGLLGEERYLDAKGQPTMTRDGVARTTYAFDSRGNIKEAAYFGTDGKPALHRNGGARIAFDFDDRDNLIAKAFFGPDGKPMRTLSGARFTYAYDERANIIAFNMFDVDGKRFLSTVGNIAGWTRTYDDRGYVVGYRYYGVDGKLTLHKEGCASDRRTYDDFGRLIAFESFGLDGQPALHIEGGAKKTFSQDSRGNILSLAYFGINGKPVLNVHGWAKGVWTYDSENRLITSTYLDLAEQPLRTEVYMGDYECQGGEPTELKPGDVFVSYNGKAVLCGYSLDNEKSFESAGDKPKELRILRAGKPLTFQIRSGPIQWNYYLETRAVKEQK